MTDHVSLRDRRTGDVTLGIRSQGFEDGSKAPGRLGPYIQVPIALLRDVRVSALALRVYLLLEDQRQRLNLTEITYTMVRMKAEVSMSDKTISNALDELEEVGLLRVRVDDTVPTMTVNFYSPMPMAEAEFVRRSIPVEQNRYNREQGIGRR